LTSCQRDGKIDRLLFQKSCLKSLSGLLMSSPMTVTII